MTQNGPSSKPSAFGGLLFRTLGNDEETNGPLPFAEDSSPFAPATDSKAVALTVADVLPQLPPELARATAIPQDQPIQVSPNVLSQALSSGQLAIPLFEVYRVCPGIFNSPVSPDDARQIQLPASKLTSFVTLAASAQAPAAASQPPASPFAAIPAASPSPAPAPASPFATSQPASPFAGAAPASPFGSLFDQPLNTAQPVAPAQPKPGATQLPPRRDPSQPPAMSIPPAPAFQVATPFSASPEASPFGLNPVAPAAPAAAPASAPPSPFPAQPVSPFSFQPVEPEAPTPMANPFGLAQPAAEPPAATQASPFETLFAPATQPMPPSMPPAPPAAAAPTIAGPAIASVATLLGGQHPDDLGFDPSMIPSWINTQFHGGIVADLHSMNSPQIELGAVVDGITDVGFRNVLHSAKRERIIPIQLTALQPAPVAPTAAASASAAPPPLTHRVEPPASFTAAPTPPSDAAPSTFRVEPGNPFSQVPEAPAPALEAAPPAPTAPPVVAPAAPAAPAAAPASFIQPIAAGLDQFTAAIAAHSNPPTPAPSPPPAPPPPAATAPFSGFSAAMDPFAPTSESADPAAGARSQNTGFSSFDLMGGESATTPPSLFPDSNEAEASPEPPSLFAPEIPEIPTTVEKPETVLPAAMNPRSDSFSWEAFSRKEELSDARPVSEPLPTPAKPSPSTFVPVEMPKPSAFIPAPEPIAQPEAPTQNPAPMFSTTATQRPATASKPSMGLSAVSAGAEEQLMLRALLGTDEELTIGRVMELTVGLPGITSCALIKGEQVLAGESTKGSDARAFRAQAAEVARSLRTLAPLIGIADAETFTLNTESRLITLCFPGAVTLGILHDREPSLGLRDKLTLIARQLEQMVKAS